MDIVHYRYRYSLIRILSSLTRTDYRRFRGIHAVCRAVLSLRVIARYQLLMFEIRASHDHIVVVTAILFVISQGVTPPLWKDMESIAIYRSTHECIYIYILLVLPDGGRSKFVFGAENAIFGHFFGLFRFRPKIT